MHKQGEHKKKKKAKHAAEPVQDYVTIPSVADLRGGGVGGDAEKPVETQPDDRTGEDEETTEVPADMRARDGEDTVAVQVDVRADAVEETAEAQGADWFGAGEKAVDDRPGETAFVEFSKDHEGSVEATAPTQDAGQDVDGKQGAADWGPSWDVGKAAATMPSERPVSPEAENADAAVSAGAADLPAVADAADFPDVPVIGEVPAVPVVPVVTATADEADEVDTADETAEAVEGGVAEGDAEGDAASVELADAAADASDSTDEPAPAEKPSAKRLSLPIAIATGVAALVVGLLIGAFLLGGAGGSPVAGKVAVDEGGLDSVIASYTYQGKNNSITVREAIEQSSSLEAAMDVDGNYRLPTADSVLGIVRNKLLVAEAERQGITASEEDVAAYAVATLGTSNFEEIAANYKMDVEAVKTLMHESCMMGRLRDTVATEEAVSMPEPPVEPNSAGEDGATTPSKQYADYIIALVGDEWDAAKGTWASTDGPFASALSGTYDITASGATYEAAAAAYYIAYQLYSQEANAAGSQWTDYVNSILSDSTIHLNTLIA